MRQVDVGLGDRSYTIRIGTGLLERVHDYVRDAGLKGRIALVTDSNVLPLYGHEVRELLSDAGFDVLLCDIPAGEASKNLDLTKELYEKLLRARLDRTSGVVALGGGVVGDLAGFVASTYMRGIALIQVPTTLLAQVDSSVGGKVGVNLPEAKNMVGSFYQPRAVIIDTNTLQTLPQREYRAGLAEVAKYGVISDANLFALLEARREAVLAQDRDMLEEIIEICCRIKADVVEQDERECGIRIILNYGHTIGHAIEAVSEYEQFRHGEAIAIGMDGAARIAAKIGLTDEDFVNRQAGLLESVGLPLTWSDMPANDVLQAMKMDKKRTGGVLRFVLPCEAGRVTVREGVDEAVVIESLKELARGAS